VVVFEAGLLLASQLQHADTRLQRRADVWLRRLLVTPNLHRVHHSRVRAEADSNFGTILTLWDRALGTYHVRDPLEGLEVGAPDGDDADADSLLGLWLMPLRGRSA
jgi:sterol desaturase/sphingolipid hydroxylase (fatty acid hydroxylase superfamily)